MQSTAKFYNTEKAGKHCQRKTTGIYSSNGQEKKKYTHFKDTIVGLGRRGFELAPPSKQQPPTRDTAHWRLENRKKLTRKIKSIVHDAK